MPIVLVRIDDRLIHGQVVEGWLKVIHSNFILVANDAVARDELQCSLYKISVPLDVGVECLDVITSAKKIKNGDFNNKQVLVLLSNTRDALRFVESEVKVVSINVGGLRYSPGKKQIMKAVFMDEFDMGNLKKIASHGIEIEGRILPLDERVNIIDKLEGYK